MVLWQLNFIYLIFLKNKKNEKKRRDGSTIDIKVFEKPLKNVIVFGSSTKQVANDWFLGNWKVGHVIKDNIS